MTTTNPKYLEPLVNENGSTSRAWWRFWQMLDARTGGSDGTISVGMIPAGMIVTFGGLTTPDFYLLCDGNAYAVADFPDLFNAIGFIYGGSGDFFNVPSLTSVAGIVVIKV